MLDWQNKQHAWVRRARIQLFVLTAVALSLSIPSDAQEGFHNFAITDLLAQTGVVSGRHVPTDAQPSKQIILIQDTHLNLTAQINLAGILRRLAEKESVFTVFVEGGWGDMRLTEFKMRGEKEVRDQSAYKLLEDGMISGEEYLDITSELPLLLWGAENQLLYNRNVEQWFKTGDIRKEFSATINDLQRWSSHHEDRFFDENLSELVRAYTDFKRGKKDITELVEYMTRLPEAESLAKAYPQIENLFRAHKLLGQIDQKSLNGEHRQLLERLRTSAPAAVQAELAQLVSEYRNKNISAEAYFKQLAEWAEAQALSMVRFANIQRYLDYLVLQEALVPGQLLDQLAAFNFELKRSMARTPEAEMLIDVEESLAYYANLAMLKWTPSDYTVYKEGKLLSFASIVKELESLNDALTEVMFFAPDTRALNQQLQAVIEFYELAEARNQAIVSNVIEKMNYEFEDRASLVVGGFHTPGLVSMFLEQGAEVIVVTPFVDESQDDQRYAHILKFKSGLITE